MSALTEEQWRHVLDLSEATAELSPEGRLEFLEAAEASPDIIREVLSLVDEFSSEDVADRVGTRIGRFTITGYLGSGGVGDVYSARDTELQRTVALKFLRSVTMEQTGATERFIREARTVSALNHSNIVTVHEIVRSETTVAVVMEFVDGRALRQICGTAIPTDRVLHIGRQIAGALAAAHAEGIVHRDIKPENVIVRGDGSLKVLDFGLAISVGARGRTDNAMSRSHLFAGTWRYMSPEQTRGEAVTSATDVFSLGLVLYELCTGRHPFPAEASLETGTALYQRKIEAPSKWNAATPKALHLLITDMLAPDPATRPSAARVAASLGGFERQEPSAAKKSRWRAVWAFAAALLLAASIGRFAYRSMQSPSHLSTSLLPIPISVEPGSKDTPSFSLDGKQVSYVWKKPGSEDKVYVQSIESGNGMVSEPVRLTRSAGIEREPKWSPDGRMVAFLCGDSTANLGICLFDLSNGRERRLIDFIGHLRAWTPDNKWLLGSQLIEGHYRIVLISPTTGETRLVMHGDPMEDDVDPSISFDRSRIAFVRERGVNQLAELRLNPDYNPIGTPVLLEWPGFRTNVVQDPVWATTKDLLFVAAPDGIPRIWQSHDARPPELVPDLGENVTNIAYSSQGRRLAYTRSVDDTNIWKLDLTGAVPKRPGTRTEVIASSRFDQRPAVSPNGTELAFESNRGGFTEIWMANLLNRQIWRLTDLKSQSGSPCWSPDGKWIVFGSSFQGPPKLYRISSTGGAPVRLTSGEGTDMLPVWSADSKSIYFSSDRAGTYQIWRIAAEGGNATEVTARSGTAPEVTADGEFLYYLKENFIESELWRKALRTGEETLMASKVCFRSVAIGKKAVYFLTPRTSLKFSLCALNPITKEVTRLGDMPTTVVGGVSLSPDEKFLYYAELDHSGDDLMLVNGFR